MTFATTKEVIDRIGVPLGIDVVILDPDKIKHVIVEHVLAGRYIIGSYRGAYKDYNKIFNYIKNMGGNPYLFDLLDATYLEKLPKEFAQLLPKARLEALLAPKPWKLQYRVTMQKKITRRTLLIRPADIIKEYDPSPIIVDPEACIAADKCHQCIYSCPERALSGKPPTVESSKCTGCGLCMQHCPFDAISMPNWGRVRIERTLSYVRKHFKKTFKILILERKHLNEIKPSIANNPYIIEAIDRIDWIDARSLVTMLKYGVEVLIYDPEGTLKEKNDVNSLANRIEDQETLANKLSSPTNHTEVFTETKTAADIVRAMGLDELKTATPVLGLATTTKDCTLCDACIANCPTNALEKNLIDDQLLLVFTHNNCVGCKICEEVCPQNAIKVEWVIKPKLYDRKIILARDRLVKCKSCGRPIGSRSMISKVEEAMKSRNLPEKVIESIYLCDECKKRVYEVE